MSENEKVKILSDIFGNLTDGKDRTALVAYIKGISDVRERVNVEHGTRQKNV